MIREYNSAMWKRVMQLLRRLSPLAPWRLLQTLNEVREVPALRTQVQRGLKETKKLKKQILTERKEIQRELNALTRQIKDERTDLAGILTRIEQSRAVYRSDIRSTRALDRALQRIGDARVPTHVRAVVAEAPTESDPCPYIVLDDLLPDAAYDALVAAIPPPLFFEHLPVTRQDLKVPFEFAPRYHREIWHAFQQNTVLEALIPALSDKFKDSLDRLVRTHWPGIVNSMADAGISLQPAAARVMRRRPGYEIKPHRDPHWTFLTCILYLTKRDDRQLYGTQLCRLQHEEEFPTHSPFWVPDEDIEVVREVPGRPNSAVVFLNSTGAHRASIPADAPPETDRYIYQVQLGAERAVRDALTARLPADHPQRLVQKDTTFKY